MFLTDDDHEFTQMSRLSADGLKYWHTITLTGVTPWYLLVYLADFGGAQVRATAFVEWEENLVQMVTSVPAERRLGICRMEASAHPTRWNQRWVQALWENADSEERQPGEVIFQFEGEAQFLDASLQPVPKRPKHAPLFSQKRPRTAEKPADRRV